MKQQIGGRSSAHGGVETRRSGRSAAPARPDEFWDAAPMRAASAGRHFGQLLREYRRASNVGQAEVAQWLGVSQGQISRIERDRSQVHDLDKLERWAKALKIPQRLLWFQLSGNRPAEFAGGDGSLNALRTVSRPDEQVGLGMRQLFRWLGNEVADEPEAPTENVFRAAAESYLRGGWYAYDDGEVTLGSQRMRIALNLSRRSGEAALSAEILAALSFQSLFHGTLDSAVPVIRMAEQAAERSGLTLLKVEVASMAASCYAMMGDRDTCLTVLRRAERSLETINSTDPTDRLYLASGCALSFRFLGWPREAEGFARTAVKLSERWPGVRLCTRTLLASALADQRKIEEACATASQVVPRVAPIRPVRDQVCLTSVVRRLSKFGDDVSVRTLYGQLAGVGVAVPRI
ncbi:MAG: helix-turn-helix transcriptional regulator [Kibdelosporangium sp.]